MKRVIAVIMTLLMILPCTAFAAERIDVDKECSLTISYMDETTPVAGSKCDIYYVASTDETGEVTKYGDFAKYDNVFIRGRDDEAWNKLALTLKGYALKDNIKPVTSAVTGTDGKVKVEKLKTGLYLVVPSVTYVGNYKYTGQPIMTFLPGTDSEKNARDYDLTINIKFEKTYVPPYIPPDNPPDPPKPSGKTIDLSAVKIWIDEGFEKERPSSVTVDLLKDGEVYDTVKLTKKNNWKHTWKELDAEYEWLVVEEPVENYMVTVEYDGTTYYVTNQNVNFDPNGGGDELPGDDDNPGFDPHGNGDTPPDKLPQTGQLWWPVPALMAAGLLFLVIGFVKRRGEYDEE